MGQRCDRAAAGGHSANGNSPFIAVGSYPVGNGRWGHADLAGSLYELVLDWMGGDWYATTETGCSDGANLTAGAARLLRGGYWGNDAFRAADRASTSPENHDHYFGFQCSRTP